MSEQSLDQKILTEMLSPALADNPLAWVLYAYPWGEKDSPLEQFEGPRKWQVDELTQIAEHIQNNHERARKGDNPQIYMSATASGRGVGKSTLFSWLSSWMMSTRLGSTTIVSANSETQLKTKTMAELGKWHAMAMNRDWFERGSLTMKPSDWFSQALKTQLGIDSRYYYVEGTLWSEEDPDSFAGAHNMNGVMVIFDEASGIPAPIWTVSEGFFTEVTHHRFWFAFSNPRRNTGAFFDCFHNHREFWRTRNLDSRTVEHTDLQVLDAIVKKYGEDSDEARVEVKGQFPRTGDRQFIGRELVQESQDREGSEFFDAKAPLVMGVDPARFGSDSSVICFRQGRTNQVGLVPPTVKLKGVDNMVLADKIAWLINQYNPDAVCIDGGNGAGVIDRLKQRGFRVHEVMFGSRAETDTYMNKRAELWGRLKEWLSGAALDRDPELLAELTGPEYKYPGNGDRLALESKEDMKKRGIPSPDYADALACTFAVTVAYRSDHTSRFRETKVARDVEYDIFG